MGCFQRICDKFKTKKIPADVDDGLETLDEYKSRWRSVKVIYFTMFLMSLGFSIILTGIWPFLNKVNMNEILLDKIIGIYYNFTARSHSW